MPSSVHAPLRRACAAFVLSCSLAAAQPPAHSADAALQRQVRQAAALAAQGHTDEAMQLAGQVLTQHPQYAPALKLKAMLLERSGRDTEASVLYEEALKLAPSDADLLLKVGVAHLRAHQFAAAIPPLERCARILPAEADVHFYLAQAYHLNGQDDRALAAIRIAVKAGPSNAALLQKYGELLCSQKQFDEGSVWLHKAQAIDASLPLIDYDLAWAGYNRMALDEAADFATRAVRRQPGDPNALQLLAMIRLKQQQWQPAKQAFEQLIALRPATGEELQNLGQCELELKNYSAAAARLQAALHLDPTLLLARFFLARTYSALGRTAEAQQQASLHRLMMDRMTFVRAVTLEQRQNAIAPRIRELLRAQREDEAIRVYRDTFRDTAATESDARVFLGKTQLFMGQTDDGLRNLALALKLDPHVHDAHTTLGLLALKQGDLARAESEFRAELANDPNAQSAIAELGEVRYHQQRWAEAAQQFDRSHTMTPELLYMLADAQFHLGRAQDALLTAQLVAVYGRSNPPLLDSLVHLVRINGQDEAANQLAAGFTSAAPGPLAP